MTPVATLPPCAAGQIALTFDGRPGDVAGMSQSGTRMILRNVGGAACRMSALPRLGFSDGGGVPLPIVFRPPPGLHPGPAVPPVAVAPGAEATAELRWVSQDVFAPRRCFAPAAVTVSFDTTSLERPFDGTICGPADGPATYDQQWLTADPSPSR